MGMIELKVYHCNEWHNEYTEFYMKSEADAYISRQKYKRCLEYARHHKTSSLYFDSVADFWSSRDEKMELKYRNKVNHHDKYVKLWLNIAEKFKESK